MLDFYYVDKDYIDYMQHWDPKVPNVDYDSHKKFVCGVVLEIGDADFYAPVSHFNRKNATSFPIYDRDRIISTVRLAFMFPVIPEALTQLRTSDLAKTDPKYAGLVRKELAYCRDHEKSLQERAQRVYKRACNPRDFLYERCCKFDFLLERVQFYEKGAWRTPQENSRDNEGR